MSLSHQEDPELARIGVMARKSPGQSEVCDSCANHPTPRPSFPRCRADPGP